MKLKNGKKKLNEKTQNIKQIHITNTYKFTYDYQQFETTRSFGDNVYTSKINIDEAYI